MSTGLNSSSKALTTFHFHSVTALRKKGVWGGLSGLFMHRTPKARLF